MTSKSTVDKPCNSTHYFSRADAAAFDLSKPCFAGYPIAWSILGVIALGCIGYWIYSASKSTPCESSKNPYEVPNTPLSESFCPRCGMRVMPLADGMCPSCREH